MINREPGLWIKAEEDFSKWILNQDVYPENEHTRLLKSIYIVFRKKFHELLTPLLAKLYENVPPIVEIQQEEVWDEQPYVQKNVYYSFNKSISWGNWYEDGSNLLNKLRIADPEALADLYKNEFPKISALVTKNNGTIEDAQDLFQDGLVILIDKFVWGKTMVIDCSPGTYMYSICRNLWYNKLRSMKKEKAFIDDQWYNSTVVSIEYYDEEPDNYEKVSNAISSLGDPCKELLELFYYNNYSWELIAILKGYSSPASARNQKYKCLEKIKKQLSETLER